MEHPEGACALPPCGRDAVVSLRMLVDGQEAEMATCQSHAHWLREYVEEDAVVHLLDVIRHDGQPTVGSEDGAERA